MADILIPEGFRPIAVRDDRMGTCVISFHPERRLFFLVTDGKGAGPFKLNELKALVENLKDVIDLKGRFIYIEDYEPDGTKKI